MRPLKNLDQGARDLAIFVRSLHQIKLSGGPKTRRGGALKTQSKEVEKALAQLEHELDVSRVQSIWQTCIDAPVWSRALVWIHCDLLPANILAHNDKIVSILDFDMFGMGDPAIDLLPAWSVFSGESRKLFIDSLGYDESMVLRAIGWALSIGLIIIPYYQETNKELCEVGWRFVREVLADFA